jgi:hypothetical protein
MNEASNFCSGTQCKPDTANETALYCECLGVRVPDCSCCCVGLVCGFALVACGRLHARTRSVCKPPATNHLRTPARAHTHTHTHTHTHPRVRATHNRQHIGLEVETPRDFDITALIPQRTTCQMACSLPNATNTLDNPPYALKQAGGLKLYEKTISMTASECCACFLLLPSSSVSVSAICVGVTGPRSCPDTRSTAAGSAPAPTPCQHQCLTSRARRPRQRCAPVRHAQPVWHDHGHDAPRGVQGGRRQAALPAVQVRARARSRCVCVCVCVWPGCAAVGFEPWRC